MTTGRMTRENWAGSYEYRAPVLHEPESVEEVQRIVAAAGSVTALGSRHSFNDIADSPEAQISLAKLPPRLEIDEAARTVTVDAGVRYGGFVERLHLAGWAIHNLASLPHISVAGAISTGTHGSGDGNGSLATAVAGLEFVTADGSLHRVVRGDTDFEGMVVSLGALGIMTAVTLDIEPTFEVRQDVFDSLAWPQLLEHFDEIMASAYSVSIFTDWGTAGGRTVWLKSRLDALTDAASASTLFGATRATAGRHPLPDGPSENSTVQGGVAGPAWDRLAHFRGEFTPSNGNEMQSEYLLPRENAIAAIEAVRALEPLIGPLLMISELRTMSADSLWLSPAYGHETLGIHFTWKNELAVYDILPALDAALAPLGGRPHWGKVFTADAETLDARYPKLEAFRQLAARVDPTGKFRNGFLDRTIFA